VTTMPRDLVKTLGTLLLVANALVAFLSLTNLTLVAAGAIVVSVPGADDLAYAYDRANATVLVTTAFTVGNRGIYPVRDLDIDSRLASPWGSQMASYMAHGLKVRAGEVRTFPVTVGLSASELLDGGAIGLLFEDGEFELQVRVRAAYTMGLTRFASDEVERYEWRAPLGHMRELLGEHGLLEAATRALGWAAPLVREQLSRAVLDSVFSDGERRELPVGGWANLSYRLWLDQDAGAGAFEAVLHGEVAGHPWSLGAAVPLRIVDGMVMLGQEAAPDGG
jgi:hypothetical protein